MNKLQKTEFALLQQFVSICDKLDISYFMLCGSALGSAKYGGFIPWDDDIDVGIFREDYERFLKCAPDLLPDGLFLQTYKSDENYCNIFAKLRNSNTTFIEKSCSKMDINHGVYIDIFPLDGYPKKKSRQTILELKKMFYKQRLSSLFKNSSLLKKILKMPLRLITIMPQKTVCKYEKLISSFGTNDADVICNHGNWQGRLEYSPREQYGEGMWATFEGLKIRIPEKYDEYLTKKYGDWRADLPPEQQIGHHYAEVIDLERPYTYYIKHLKNGKISINHLNNLPFGDIYN